MSWKLLLETFVAFFNFFRKGPVVCRSLDLDLSGKVAKKLLWHRKRGRHIHNVFLRSYRCIRNLSPSMADAAATAYTHFGNAKPKFNMNCWPTISINDRSCQQRSTGPANFLTCTYSFIFTITKVLANSRGMHTRTVIFTHNIEQN